MCPKKALKSRKMSRGEELKWSRKYNFCMRRSWNDWKSLAWKHKGWARCDQRVLHHEGARGRGRDNLAHRNL
jgi:hypothetical protein